MEESDITYSSLIIHHLVLLAFRAPGGFFIRLRFFSGKGEMLFASSTLTNLEESNPLVVDFCREQ